MPQSDRIDGHKDPRLLILKKWNKIPSHPNHFTLPLTLSFIPNLLPARKPLMPLSPSLTISSIISLLSMKSYLQEKIEVLIVKFTLNGKKIALSNLLHSTMPLLLSAYSSSSSLSWLVGCSNKDTFEYDGTVNWSPTTTCVTSN